MKDEKPADTDEYSYHMGMPLYISMSENFEKEYGSFYGMTVDEAFTKRGITVEVGESDRWFSLFSFFQATVMFLGIVIAVRQRKGHCLFSLCSDRLCCLYNHSRDSVSARRRHLWMGRGRTA